MSAIDARGLELFTCIRLSQPGIESQCRKCIPKETNLRIEIIPAEPVFNTWRPLIAAETKLQGQVKKNPTLGR